MHSKDAGLHLQSCGEGDQPYGHLQGQSIKGNGLHLQGCGEGDQPYGHLQGQSMWGTVSFSLNRLFHRCVFVTTFGYSAQEYITTLKYRHYTCCILRTFTLPINGAVNSTYRTVCVGICTLITGFTVTLDLLLHHYFKSLFSILPLIILLCFIVSLFIEPLYFTAFSDVVESRSVSKFS